MMRRWTDGLLAATLTVLAWAGPAAAGDEAPTDPLVSVETRGRVPVEPMVMVRKPTFVLQGGRVLTAAGDVHETGWVAVRNGTIEGVGAGEPPSFEGATVLDVTGSTITPGLVDSHSHLGVYPSPSANAHSDGNEASAPVTAGVWAEHSTWPQDPGFERALAGGVTSLLILPGSANLIGGRGVTVQNVPHRGSRAMRFPGAPEIVKMACGENPKRVYGVWRNGAPSTRMGNLRGQREAYLRAQRYLEEWRRYEKDLAHWEAEQAAANDPRAKKKRKKDAGPEEPNHPPMPPKRDLELDTLAGVLTGRVLPQVHCYRADDMLSFLQLAEEFEFRIRGFHHALEAYKIRDILAKKQVSSSTWADWWGFKLEAYDGIPFNAAMLEDAGAPVVIHSDSAIGIQRLNQEAAKAWQSGREAGIELTEDEVLRWITYWPAWTLGIHELTGTLETGKRADLVVWDGSPWSVYTQADLVFVDGVLQYDADRPIGRSDFETGQGHTPRGPNAAPTDADEEVTP